ncbi:unnamed protein product [Vitrella brassicaformis CCMP3155]|uniref:AAA+ ATPase domain-containing protein n=2 Tax=Vitrella brassicaformis TaxID=1169539 RepID=A0A0G4GAJ9_VITBC|nr:unnamed protein product [Vitrella brassicaformis CCMP3155]|mmetsp:Transcript_28934/g.72110  ORF Transcript_28934/g.72110 Transcript_28934/m.72110 type:complete len:370 (+) Transcript_28934:57-1166(+)|eukprot:CEM26005.1 unnamed protein product [Vitrella brassicaformis CCMP3155]
MLWVDKYRPRQLDELHCHPGVTDLLRKLMDTRDFPHMMLYGPPGAGKKTRISAFLRGVYGQGAEKMKVSTRSFKIPPSNSTTVECQVLDSPYHIEVSPADVGTGSRDTAIVQILVKETASALQPAMGDKHVSFKVVVINEVDRLSHQAQAALRRTMEKYVGACRIIMTANNFAKVLPPIRSRCLCIRVPSPTNQEIREVMHQIAVNENITVPDDLVDRIIAASGRDLRRALLMLETAKIKHYPFKANQKPPLVAWEEFLEKEICDTIMKNQTPKGVIAVRSKYYDLMGCMIPADVILKTLVKMLLKKVSGDTLKSKIVTFAASFEHTMRLGAKEIFHLEAFTANVMSAIKQANTSQQQGGRAPSPSGGS